MATKSNIGQSLTNDNVGIGVVPVDGTDKLQVGGNALISGNARYASDVSASFTNRSFVDKGFLESNFSKYLLNSIIPTASVTGTTAETVLFTWFVPANTFSAVDRISIEDLTIVSNGSIIGTSTARIRFNTSATLDTSTNNKTFATISFAAGSGDRFFRAERIIDIIDVKIKGFFNLAGSFSDKISSVYSSNDFNPTINNYFFITIQPADVNNSIYMKNLIIKR
jgi:hypothetical protein